jgi:hypothetical protein
LPPAALGDHALDTVTAEVGLMADLAARLNTPLAGCIEQRVNVELVDPSTSAGSTTRIDGSIRSVHVEDPAHIVVDIDYRRPKSSHRLALAVRLAAAHLADPEHDWSGILITRGESGKPPRGLTLTLIGDGVERNRSAMRIVKMAVELALWSMRDAVPLFDTASELLAGGRTADAANALENAYRDAYESMLWPGLSLASMLEDPVEPTDPQPVRETATQSGASRAMATAQWVWGTYGGAIAEVDADDADSSSVEDGEG